MKRNVMLLTDQVREKLTAKCLTAVVTEAFINALPFDKSELAAESENFSRYAVNVIEKMHPETLLDKAMESTKDNQKANLYVQNLKLAIESVVEIATKRIVQEAMHIETPTPDIVAQVKLDDAETEKFINASKQSGTDAVAKLVKDKMIDVIKDEKNAYDTAAKLREEVREVIKAEQEDLKMDKDADAIESYLDLVLEPTDARNHISVFSKMQDVCMEAIMHSTEKYEGEIPYQTMEKITLESTFPFFDLSNRSLLDELNNMIIVTESAVVADGDCDDKKKAVAKTAFICTICIMTLLETLKTMHLAKPEMADVKNFVEDATDIKNLIKTDLRLVEDKVIDAVDGVKKSAAMGACNLVELDQAKESLEKVRGILENMTVPEAETTRKTRILNRITSALEAIKPANESDIKPITSYYVGRMKEDNITALEHAITIISRKPIVESIKINLRSDMKCENGSNVALEAYGFDAMGKRVCNYMFNINAVPDLGNTIADVVTECASYCNIGNKPVQMYFSDTGCSVPLK